jgi:2-methylisocitrate lyase-like PEP mutase family enzyme
LRQQGLMMRDSRELVEKAALLRSLHVPGRPVVLPNAWDATSALVFAEAGFAAIATSSGAIANSLGYDDGEYIPRDEMFAAIERVTRAVRIPTTADVERGYRLPADEFIARLLDAGAVGCNLEDSDPQTGQLADCDEQAALLRAVRAAADAAGVSIVLNARVDVHFRAWGEVGERLAEAVRRARQYREAGADCVYPLGLADPADIDRFVSAVGAPVNIAFRPQGPSFGQLASLGVARVTFGPGLHLAARSWLTSLAARLIEGKDPYSLS